MIDPRFANAGAAPFVAGFGAQQVPMSYRHHRHHKHKSRKDQSPLSRDESIHKVDHGQTHAFQQNDGAPFSGGYGVPYGVPTNFAPAPAPVGVYQQPPQFFGAAPFGFANQFSNVQFGFGAPAAAVPATIPGTMPTNIPIPQNIRHHHRRHHRHHRQHAAEQAAGAAENADQGQAAPEQLIGQRSSSVVGEEAGEARSPVPTGETENQEQPAGHHRHRHRHHRRHHGEHGVDLSQSRQKSEQCHTTSVGADGYGHINSDLIFIERGDQSPHRQDPPPGYEYKGKIEVQGANREHRSQSHGRESFVPSGPPPMSAPMPPPVGGVPGVNFCPPGWQQVVLPSAPGGPCPPGMPMFGAQMGPGAGFGATPFGAGVATVGGGLANLAASLPLPPQGQIVADYIVDAGGAGQSSTAENVFSADQQSSGGFRENFEESHDYSSTRPTIIEVWQKRSKSEQRDKSRSRSRSHSRQRSRSRSGKGGSSVDLDQFRNDILKAIDRIARGGQGGAKPWNGHDGGTQTQLHPTSTSDSRRDHERRTDSNAGEVRVIVQPIQPVFYMPRQTTGSTTPQFSGGAGNFQPQQGGSGGGSNVVYVPRNVYVPVIKPVFVPRERVIVRPQVIHVARPVLVDRPVPVTQRPIIIDRERPVPVPIRGANQGGAQAAGSSTVREEYVYRDNLPVAYGGRCAEFAGGVNYGYMPTQQETQYASSSTQEVTANYQAQGPVINVTDQYQSQSNSNLEVQQDVASFHGSYSNLAQGGNASSVNVEELNQQVLQQTLDQTSQAAGLSVGGPAQIEILDTTVNPYWQKTDQSTLVRRYGRPAYEIVHKTDQVEQQMYTELRHQSGSVEIQRSASSASYGSGSAIDGVGIPQY